MKKLMRTLLVLLLACVPVFSGTAAAAAKMPSPYAIMVNRQQNTLTVYTMDANGEYTVPYKAMICSTAREGFSTPLGTYDITGIKLKWCLMVDGSYGQYSTQFNGDILFHSVCYTKANPSTLITEEYNMLGSPASRGCVRLQVQDAKWIYESCPAGTSVTVYESEDPGPLGKPARRVDYIQQDMPVGWDPTDPNPQNPWPALLLPFDDVSHGAWYCESVEKVCAAGLMQGVGSRQFCPEKTLTRSQAVQILYNLAGRPSDPDCGRQAADVQETDWYSPAVLWYINTFDPYDCAEDEDGGLLFLPERTASREYFVQLLYQLCQRDGVLPQAPSGSVSFTDSEQLSPAAEKAVCAFFAGGIVSGYPDGSFRPDASVARSEAAKILAAVAELYGTPGQQAPAD